MHLKINMAIINGGRRATSRRSHEKIGDCEQSTAIRYDQRNNQESIESCFKQYCLVPSFRFFQLRNYKKSIKPWPFLLLLSAVDSLLQLELYSAVHQRMAHEGTVCLMIHMPCYWGHVSEDSHPDFCIFCRPDQYEIKLSKHLTQTVSKCGLHPTI